MSRAMITADDSETAAVTRSRRRVAAVARRAPAKKEPASGADDGGDRDRRADPQGTRCVPEEDVVRTGADGNAREPEIGSECPSRSAVDDREPSGVVRLAENEDAGLGSIHV